MWFVAHFVLTITLMYGVFWICDRIKNRDDALITAVILTTIVNFLVQLIN